MTSRLEFGLLGDLEITNGSERIELGSGKLRVLLATLLLRANHTVSVDELVDRLWGAHAPKGARTTMQTYVMRLRRVLGDDGAEPELIHTRPGGYLIGIRPEQLDLHRFRELIERETFHEALRLWRGPALVDVPSESLRRDEVPRLAEERLQALERRIELDLRQGRHRELVVELAALTREHPLRERFWLQLMLALFRSGRQAEALERYREVRDLLVEELGVEPGAELRALHAAMLREDPSLHAAEQTRTGGPPDDRAWWATASGPWSRGWGRCGWQRARGRDRWARAWPTPAGPRR
ncbi:MAG TPA: AfsR/SARP family transcriptional regulator [Actinophytocola sp.]|uniref:AfsR/SARP family transcriptional regulator n=1 Tax=Actinophytocola sp. TaxID=1872138 RepID=UPI002DDD61F0|nr:AfsR/SARP family transcriptional regulator [Actinophytocola sp.]HEV2781582.1 AfsR/SARP family transcriptional regulator [Actinophytocola sp.]